MKKTSVGVEGLGPHYHSVVHSSTPSHDPMMKGQKEGGLVKKKTSVEVEGFGPLYPSLVHPPHPPLASRLFSPTP